MVAGSMFHVDKSHKLQVFNLIHQREVRKTAEILPAATHHFLLFTVYFLLKSATATDHCD